MRTTDQNRVNMLNATYNIVTSETYKNVWKDHEAFSEGVIALGDAIMAVDNQSQIAQGNPGASDVKEQARLALCKSVCEVIGAVRAYATVKADPELAAKVDYAESDVTAGKGNEVVARCRAIHAAATDNLSALGKYGVTAAKLAACKRAIDTFEKLKSAPRQGRVAKLAAARLLPQLVRSAVAVARDQLDGLMVQFQEANPNFYEEYFAARRIVDTRGARANSSAQARTTSLPGAGTTPVNKAA